MIGVVEVINRNDGLCYSEDDISLLETLAHQAAIVIERARLHQAVLEKQRLEHELLFARKIQERFWPEEPPRIPGVEIAAKSEPSTQVGGDYYDFIPLSDGRIGIAIGDVSGKDVSAALLMATARMALRTQAEEGSHSLSEIFFRVNNTLMIISRSSHPIRLPSPSRSTALSNTSSRSASISSSDRLLLMGIGSMITSSAVMRRFQAP